ncbi:MAG: aminotransferase class IV [Bacteroidales bacterium]|nr:aminotransferase class IV [Bacteroidales bacterium]
MFDKTQIIYNGKYIPAGSIEISYKNRAFLYGDSIFETIRVNNRKVLFLEEHLQRLVSGMKVLKYEVPDKFTVFRQKLEEEIIQLLNRNKIFKASRIRITVFRKPGGLYTPQTNDVDYIISSSKLEDDKFKLNTKGLLLGIFNEIKKPQNVFSQYKTANSIIYTMAGIYKNENNFDDCLILNNKGNILESISSNIFTVKSEKLTTPPVIDGCINGIMRNKILKLAKQHKIVCIEKSIDVTDLLKADEVFLSNSISGVKWVVAYKNKRYYKRMSDFLIRKLNDSLD